MKIVKKALMISRDIKTFIVYSVKFMNFKSFYPLVKRCIDVIASAMFLIALSPLLLCLAIAVRATSSGPSIFWSERVGRNGKAFSMPKFRTMTTCSKVMVREQARLEDFKLTPIGNFLRKTSLDELPQLWSVLIGHMSLIGPRPLLASDLGVIYRAQYSEISIIRPGITGLAQIKGRNLVRPRDKARYDGFYGQKMCLILDIRIFISTIRIMHRNDFVA